MRKFMIVAALVLAGTTLASAQNGGFTGPGPSVQAQTITVSQAGSLRDDTWVTLKGTIVQSLGKEKYTFRDATGDIVVEIDGKIWQGISVGPTDTVEISGKIDVERRSVTIDVKTIRKA